MKLLISISLLCFSILGTLFLNRFSEWLEIERLRVATMASTPLQSCDSKPTIEFKPGEFPITQEAPPSVEIQVLRVCKGEVRRTDWTEQGDPLDKLSPRTLIFLTSNQGSPDIVDVHLSNTTQPKWVLEKIPLDHARLKDLASMKLETGESRLDQLMKEASELCDLDSKSLEAELQGKELSFIALDTDATTEDFEITVDVRENGNVQAKILSARDQGT